MSGFRFYLVRHGAAEPKAPSGSDGERRLTPTGRDAFAALARTLAPRMTVSRVVTSPLARARETAALLAAATGAPVEVDDALSSGATEAAALLALARRLGAGVALVGHNPEVAEAVAAAARRHVAVAAGAVAAIDADAAGVRLAWLEAPDA